MGWACAIVRQPDAKSDWLPERDGTYNMDKPIEEAPMTQADTINAPTAGKTEHVDVLIVGAGISGIGSRFWGFRF